VSLGFAPGTTFAGYRVESVVGRGGMGVVYRASELSLQRTIALKLIAPELAGDEDFRRRFLRESRLAASLEHANVVPIYEAGERDGQLYLAMRYIDGSDLRAQLNREGVLAPERTLGLLAQIADALDAAHRRGLVHRDVKPGNVLLDHDGHAYLTDFGVTKQLGGDSTESGQLVGTLDYLAPEQIRGDPIDARADVYALACVLYQCLAGAAPFHRATEAETLWAHMQEEPPRLPQHPALTPVLRKGLAKERDDRYGSCAELVEEARAALAHGRVPRRLLRRRHVILAAGLLALAATTTAAIVTMTEDDGPRPPPIGNGVASIRTTDEHVTTFAEAGTAPSNIAVGEGAVWALNTESDTISRIDPGTGRVSKTFEAGARPSDIAAGGGAVWVGDGSGRYLGITHQVLRIDPDSGAITRTEKLSGAPDVEPPGPPSIGFPQLAVGAGAVWARNPDGTVSRIDTKSGRRIARIKTPVPPSTLAAGAEGVWFLSWNHQAVFPIDTRTNRVGESIPVPTDFLSGIAVGAGSVWATSPQDGLLWRIDAAGPRPIARSIDVGAVNYVAFGDGAVWTADYVSGTASRIDPRTNAVTARVPVGASQSLAVGAGAAWVSVAAGTKDGRLPASVCSEVVSGGTRPDVLIASDLPLQGPLAASARAMADAIRFQLKDLGFKGGRHTVGYQSCDDSTAQTGSYEPRRCAANAGAYARADRLVAVIGPEQSYCAQAQIGILNRAPGGPLAMVSPSASQPNLTRVSPLADPDVGLRGEPDVYYPTGTRNFFRLTARDDRYQVALAVLAQDLGLDRVYLLRTAADRASDTYQRTFRRAAGRLGTGIAGAASFSDDVDTYRALAAKVARSGADGVLVSDYFTGELIKALRARLGPRAVLMTSEGNEIPYVLESAGSAAHGLYMAGQLLIPAVVDPTPALARFTRDQGNAAHAEGALHAAQATEVVLRAIARSDGTRASVLEQLHATRITDGLIGSFSFDRHGDIAPPTVPILRVTGRTPPDLHIPPRYQGAVIDRVVTIPQNLVE
jgi:ABC-type branched-subunit amino acid transport system substrate-binding protein/streptogramin lyase